MRLEQKYSIDRKKITWRILDGEAVILNLDNGYYYSLNEVGTRIWQAIDKGKSSREIIDYLQEEYQVEKRQLQNDLAEIIKDLEKEGLILALA